MNIGKRLYSKFVCGVAALAALGLAGSTAQAQTGAKIAFQSTRDGNGEIYAMNVDGTNVVRLTNNAALDRQPSISPDSSKVLFTSSRDGNAEIYVVNSDGTGLVRLTNNASDDEEPVFSGDGKRIAWSSDRAGSGLEIWTMNADGTAQAKFSKTGYAHDASWSADGRKVLYAGNAQLTLVNADGTGAQQIPNTSGFLPTVNRDATKVLFPSGGISIINADGTNKKVLIVGGSNPFFSPDSTRFVYETSAGLFIANADGSSPIQINNTTTADSDPSFGGVPGAGGGGGGGGGGDPGTPVNIFQISVPYTESTFPASQTSVRRAFSLPIIGTGGVTNFRLTRFNARTQAYETLASSSPIRRGEGYFLRPATDEAIQSIDTLIRTPNDDRTRRPMSGNSFDITLSRRPSTGIANSNNGWNLIGFPFDPARYTGADWFAARVTLPDGRILGTVQQAIGAGVLGNVLYNFDSSTGRYQSVRNLEAFKGYFVQTFVDGVKVTLKAN